MMDTRPYKAVITREQFWFYEMREVAKLVKEGLPDDEIIEKAQSENIFQYPTERMIKQTIMRTLVETEYIDSNKADHLNNVMVSPELENAIRAQGRGAAGL